MAASFSSSLLQMLYSSFTLETTGTLAELLLSASPSFSSPPVSLFIRTCSTYNGRIMRCAIYRGAAAAAGALCSERVVTHFPDKQNDDDDDDDDDSNRRAKEQWTDPEGSIRLVTYSGYST